MQQIENLTSFESAQNDNDFLLLKFHATWCQPCKSFAPTVDRVADTRTDVGFAAVDIDKAPSLRDQYKVRSVPTLVLTKKGKQIDTLVGTQSAVDVNKWIDNALQA